MASGLVSRTDRPNTWLLRPTLRRDRSLDNPEPSTHGPSRQLAASLSVSAPEAEAVYRVAIAYRKVNRCGRRPIASSIRWYGSVLKLDCDCAR